MINPISGEFLAGAVSPLGCYLIFETQHSSADFWKARTRVITDRSSPFFFWYITISNPVARVFWQPNISLSSRQRVVYPFTSPPLSRLLQLCRLLLSSELWDS